MLAPISSQRTARSSSRIAVRTATDGKEDPEGPPAPWWCCRCLPVVTVVDRADQERSSFLCTRITASTAAFAATAFAANAAAAAAAAAVAAPHLARNLL